MVESTDKRINYQIELNAINRAGAHRHNKRSQRIALATDSSRTCVYHARYVYVTLTHKYKHTRTKTQTKTYLKTMTQVPLRIHYK